MDEGKNFILKVIPFSDIMDDESKVDAVISIVERMFGDDPVVKVGNVDVEMTYSDLRQHDKFMFEDELHGSYVLWGTMKRKEYMAGVRRTLEQAQELLNLLERKEGPFFYIDEDTL